jgi:type II secretory pathway component PulK
VSGGLMVVFRVWAVAVAALLAVGWLADARHESEDGRRQGYYLRSAWCAGAAVMFAVAWPW